MEKRLMATFCALMVVAVRAKIKEVFVDRAGVNCEYYEDRSGGGRGPRSFVVTCGTSYACVYKGNPHSCRWYNKNQPEFYRCLADDLKNAANACSARAVKCAKKCPGVEMRRMPNDIECAKKRSGMRIRRSSMSRMQDDIECVTKRPRVEMTRSSMRKKFNDMIMGASHALRRILYTLRTMAKHIVHN